MRLVSSEQQPIVVAFTNAGTPATGLVNVSIAIYQISDESDVTPVSNILTELGLGLYYYPAANLPDTTDDTLAFRIDGSATLADADRYKFGALVFGGYPDIIENCAVVGNGSNEVNHHYDTEDSLRILDDLGGAIENANIYIIRKEDWDNNLRTKAYTRAWSQSDGNGRWKWSCFLQDGTYVLVIDSKGVEIKYPVEVVVNATKTIWTA